MISSDPMNCANWNTKSSKRELNLRGSDSTRLYSSALKFATTKRSKISVQLKGLLLPEVVELKLLMVSFKELSDPTMLVVSEEKHLIA